MDKLPHFAKFLNKPIWYLSHNKEREVILMGLRKDTIQLREIGQTLEFNEKIDEFKIIVENSDELVVKLIPIELAVKVIMQKGKLITIPVQTQEMEVLQTLKKMVHKINNVCEKEMMENFKNRHEKYKESRQVIMVCYQKILTTAKGVSLQKAGNLYFKDHATVLHAAKTINNLLDTNKKFRDKYQDVWEYAILINPDIELNIINNEER